MNIALLRKGLGLTQKQFAKAIGTTTVSLGRWENGRCEPSGISKSILIELSELFPRMSLWEKATLSEVLREAADLEKSNVAPLRKLLAAMALDRDKLPPSNNNGVQFDQFVKKYRELLKG